MGVSVNHYTFEEYNEIMSAKEWKAALREHGIRIIVSGRLRKLVAKSLGAGMYEISKEPLKKE